MATPPSYPYLIPIKREDGFHTHYIGHFANGQQYAGFVFSLLPGDQRVVSVLHKFDEQGDHLESEAWERGDRVEVESILENAINELEDPKPGDIRIKLFSVTLRDTTFQLAVNEYGDVEYSPYGLIFSEPWNGTIVGVRAMPLNPED